MVLDVFGDLDGNGAIDALIGKRNGVVEVTAVIRHVIDLEIALGKIAGGQVRVAALSHLCAKETTSRSDIQDAGIALFREQGKDLVVDVWLKGIALKFAGLGNHRVLSSVTWVTARIR